MQTAQVADFCDLIGLGAAFIRGVLDCACCGAVCMASSSLQVRIWPMLAYGYTRITQSRPGIVALAASFVFAPDTICLDSRNQFDEDILVS